MKYFLAKTEPSTYSIDDLEREAVTLWDGVHNFEAIAQIKIMAPGDKVYIYHSMTDKRIVGLAEVIDEPFENKADSRTSWAVHMKFVAKLHGPTLADFKAARDELPPFKLITHSRLSVMSVPGEVVSWIDARTN